MITIDDNATATAAALTPDGRHAIAHHRPEAGPPGLYVFDLAGPRAPELLSIEAARWTPDVSHDGHWLAGTVMVDGARQVRVWRLDGERPAASTVVWTSRTGGSRPFWSFDGWELGYLSDNGDVMVVRLESTPEPTFAPERILRFGQLHRFVARDQPGCTVDALPDGRFVYVGKPPQRPPTHLQVVIDWFTELRERVPAD
jgi:hypothetical protein